MELDWDEKIIIETVKEEVTTATMTQREKKIYEAGYEKGRNDKMRLSVLCFLLFIAFIAVLIKTIL